jgi:hypothetical protein
MHQHVLTNVIAFGVEALQYPQWAVMAMNCDRAPKVIFFVTELKLSIPCHTPDLKGNKNIR